MALNAVVFPILPGKTDEWREFIAELNGPRHAEFTASRAAAGAHERTYLQPTPAGDLVIVTLESEDPSRSFGQMMAATDPFSVWFKGRVREIHGVDLSTPMTESPSQLVIDTGRLAALAR